MSNRELSFVFNRDGISTLATICGVLGGLFFSALLILIQQKSEYQSLKIPYFSFPAYQWIIIPLAISIIFFIFSAVFMSIACANPNDKKFQQQTNVAIIPLLFGILSFFLSFSIILYLADIFACIIGASFSLFIVIWWGHKLKT
jgi:hypothetical protein